MTLGEKHLLTDLCIKYKEFINIKQIDSISNKAKHNAWKELAKEFNAASTAGVNRSSSQLKHVRNSSQAYTFPSVYTHGQSARVRVDFVGLGLGLGLGLASLASWRQSTFLCFLLLRLRGCIIGENVKTTMRLPSSPSSLVPGWVHPSEYDVLYRERSPVNTKI